MVAPEEITVRIMQLGRRLVDVRIPTAQPLGAALEATGIQVGPGFDIRINGIVADVATPLRDGDVVTLIPRIKGG